MPRLTLALCACALAAQAAPPTLEQLIHLRTIGDARISPDGRYVAYVQSEADLEQNAFVLQLHVVDTQTGARRQLTRARKSSTDPKWSPDSKWIAFLSERDGGKAQVHVIAPDGGEAQALTKAENGAGAFAWSPDGQSLAYLATSKRNEERKKTLGDFEVVRKEYGYSHLWRIEVQKALRSPQAGEALTQGSAFSIGGDFDWSPDGRQIAFAATRNPDLIQGATADIYLVDTASKELKRLVDQPGADRAPLFSPDGNSLVFSTSLGDRPSHANRRLAVVPRAGGAPQLLTGAFDENPTAVAWQPEGIYFIALQKTQTHAFRLNPATSQITKLSLTPLSSQLSLTRDGQQVAFLQSDHTHLSEVFVTKLSAWAPRQLTDATAQTKGWTLPQDQVISWLSRDGTPIEGVLSKPADFNPLKKYPLLCVIHGGPTGIDRPQHVHPSYYPIDLWTARGALVLRVNYRGSAGYGEKFRQLNVRNLGVGDAWDVESGVDNLIAKGWVDPARVGVMGWSQGGYISAFLTTHSAKFKAVSVGAGISNWSTYYYNTDITPFTIHYLGKNPAADPDIYLKTSPMTKVREAKTPTLIQHGEFDRRVPIANAYELRQGLEDAGVPVEMVVYKGFGHGINKPKEMWAVLLHNLLWFNHHIFGDPAPDFTQGLEPKPAGALQ